MSLIPWLDQSFHFPPTEQALDEPNGLLAVGGDLSPQRLLAAYKQGIFPWYEHDQPIMWWSPAPRMVLFPAELHVSRSLRKFLKQSPFVVTFDRNFNAVVEACAAPRLYSSGTWITEDMKRAYKTLHRLNVAHSVECWDGEGKLVGGLYGVALGKVFFGESMFSLCSNASKTALVYLARQLQDWGFTVIDCQQHTEHLESMGAREISRERFEALLKGCDQSPALAGQNHPWHLSWNCSQQPPHAHE